MTLKLKSAVEQEVAAGNVTASRHPTLPLTIYKYSRECVYARRWNSVNLKCRGLVLDDDGEIVINPMPKFFNHDEPEGKEILSRNAGRPYVVMNKEDGSLINYTRYRGRLLACSAGSFVSTQAQKAAEMLRGVEPPDGGITLCAEIIYSENKIILDYGDRSSLALLNCRNCGGVDFQFHMVKNGVVPGVDITIEDILSDLPRPDFVNREGFIVIWENGDRVKFKYDEYVRIHKLVFDMNEKRIWESLRDGSELDLNNIPDELDFFIKSTKEKLQRQYDEIAGAAAAAFGEVKNLPTRKEQALYIREFFPGLSTILFLLLDNRDPACYIWEQIEPRIEPNHV